MPTFKIKNLMIDVVSGAKVPERDKLCLFPTRNCNNVLSLKPCLFFKSLSPPHTPECCRIPTYCQCTYLPTPLHCDLDTFVAGCIGPSVECAGSDLPIGCGNSEWVVIDLRKLLVNPEAIKDVQAELKDVLSAVQDRSKEIDNAMAPQTLAQADLLEKQLKDALDEIEQIKGRMGGAKTEKK